MILKEAKLSKSKIKSRTNRYPLFYLKDLAIGEGQGHNSDFAGPAKWPKNKKI